MVLKDIGSSSSRIGETVPLVVTQDVSVDGRVLIPEGTMAFARVSYCRREGALSAPVFDKPARLNLKLEHLRDVDGNEVWLRPGPDREGELQITRQMTMKPTSSQCDEFQSALEDPKARSAMEKVRRLFSDTATSLSEKEAEVLIQHNVEIPLVQQSIRTGVFGQIVNFIRDLKRGRGVEGLVDLVPLTRPAKLTVRAVRELCRLSGGISSYIEGRFKGRNIRCEAGVELTVYAGAAGGQVHWGKRLLGVLGAKADHPNQHCQNY